jgi:fumarate reductase subunit D
MGLFIAFIGAVMMLAGKFNLPFGHLPGDITYQKKNVTVFAPFGTMLVISIIITLLLNIISRWKH